MTAKADMDEPKRPSANWPPPGERLAKMNEESRNRIVSLVSTLPWERIEDLATSLRDPRVPCTVNREKYTWGTFSLVLEITFEDSVAWVIRLRLPPGAARWFVKIRRVEEQILASEIATMQLVRERTIIPIPEVFASSCSPDNKIGAAYIIQEGIVGYRPREIGLDFYSRNELPAEKSERYMRQLADYHLQLSKIRFPMIGSIIRDEHGQYDVGPGAAWQKGPHTSSIGYYLAQTYMLAAAAQRTPLKTPQEHQRRLFVAWLYRTAIVHVASSGDLKGPFPLRHNDLHMDNTLVDKDGNILAVLDWDAGGTVPLEKFATPSGLFSVLPSNPVPVFHERVKQFNRILCELEPDYYPEPTTASGRSFAALHASTEGLIASEIAEHLGGTRCSFELAADLYKLVFGEGDVEEAFKRITSGALYRSWVEGLKRKTKAKEKAGDE